jgi:hypothetical protein
VLEFLDLGARLRPFSRLGRGALVDLGLALRDDLSDGFSLRIREQIFQILI